MNRRAIEHKYKNIGLATKHVIDEPGKVYEAHRHGKVFLYSLKGLVKIKLDSKDWRTISPDQELIINRNQLHEAVVGPDGWEYIFAWDPQEAKKYGN